MKFDLLVIVAVLASAGLISYFYDHLVAGRNLRRKRNAALEHLATLPEFTADFSTPEGAVLCFENRVGKLDIEAAAACRDFEAEARLWLSEKGHLSQEMKSQLLPETVRSVEKSFRDGLAKGRPVDWARGKTYFTKREPFSPGITVIRKTTHLPNGNLLSQRVLVTKHETGWKVIKYLPAPAEDPE